MKRVQSTKPNKVNSIFSIELTSRRNEVVFCCYNGFYFGKIRRDPARPSIELNMLLTETFFADRYVCRGIEYTPDKFACLLQDDSMIYLIDRAKKQVSSKIDLGVPRGCPNPFNFELFKIPGYSQKRFPFLFVRDDYSIKVLNVNTKRLIKVKDAFYGSQAGYKTLDLITSPNNKDEFEVVLLETG